MMIMAWCSAYVPAGLACGPTHAQRPAGTGGQERPRLLAGGEAGRAAPGDAARTHAHLSADSTAEEQELQCMPVTESCRQVKGRTSAQCDGTEDEAKYGRRSEGQPLWMRQLTR